MQPVFWFPSLWGLFAFRDTLLLIRNSSRRVGRVIQVRKEKVEETKINFKFLLADGPVEDLDGGGNKGYRLA